MNRRRDHTALSCLAIAAIAATFNVGRMAPTPAPIPTDPQVQSDHWWDPAIDLACTFTWGLPAWCPRPVKVVVPPWCNNVTHHHAVPTRHVDAATVGVVVDDGAPFRR